LRCPRSRVVDPAWPRELIRLIRLIRPTRFPEEALDVLPLAGRAFAEKRISPEGW
jgi:hypothetical protein